MLKALHLGKFTVFSEARLDFGRNLNLIIGENASGKSHILKAAYSALAASAKRGSNGTGEAPSKSQLQAALANKLVGVFRPDGLGRLVHRTTGRSKSEISYEFDDPGLDLSFSFSTVARTEVTIDKMPRSRELKLPVFLPTRELLTIAPGFVAIYETIAIPFEETWRDTCLLLEAPLARGPHGSAINALLAPLEKAMGGQVDVDSAGKFYLNSAAGGAIEIHLVAEGIRKLAMVARLIVTGSLQDKGYLFWDEPEANLNPKLIKTVARTILQIAAGGVQVFVASHSLFLMRELYILQSREFASLDTACFGLHLRSVDDVEVKQGRTIDEIGDIAALDEELSQADRYIETEMPLASGPGE